MSSICAIRRIIGKFDNPHMNRWEPLDVDSPCRPIDYTSMIRGRSSSHVVDFAINRTIVLFGDSIDRECVNCLSSHRIRTTHCEHLLMDCVTASTSHNDHLCQFFNGRYEMIDADHPWSPPYPVGEEERLVGREFGRHVSAFCNSLTLRYR